MEFIYPEHVSEGCSFPAINTAPKAGWFGYLLRCPGAVFLHPKLHPIPIPSVLNSPLLNLKCTISVVLTPELALLPSEQWRAPIEGGLNHSALVIATLCAIWPMSHCIISYLNRSNLESMELCSNFELLYFWPPDLYKPILCQAEILHAWFVLLWICVVCSLRILKLYPAHLLMNPCLSIPRITQTALQQLRGDRWQPRLMVLRWANCRRVHGRN